MRTYQNKLFSILGDSISTLDGYNPREYEVFYKYEKCYKANIYSSQDTWWGQVIDALGGELLVNNSWSGSMVCKHRLCEIPSFGASDERTSSLGKDGLVPDVIMVYLGTNDWGAGMKINPDVGDEKNIAVFRVAYRTMLEKIKRNYPNAEIWCFTLGVSRCTRNPMFEFPYRYAGKHIEEYCTVIRDCANDNGCRLIDLFDETKQDPFDTIDGFHPNAEGMKMISSVVIRQIKNDTSVDEKEQKDMEYNQHIMHLNREPFEQFLRGEKTVELRLNDEKRRALRIGDTIRFIHSENEQKSFDGQIVSLFSAKSFAELFRTVSPVVCGFGMDSAEEATEEMYRYYSAEDEKLYGVVGIEVKILGG